MIKRCLVLRRDGLTRLFGDVYNDPRFPDGHWILTSAVTEHTDNVYVTETPTRYEVERKISIKEMCEIWKNEKLPTEGVKYCVQVANIVRFNMDKDDPVLMNFLKEMHHLAKYDEENW